MPLEHPGAFLVTGEIKTVDWFLLLKTLLGFCDVFPSKSFSYI